MQRQLPNTGVLMQTDVFDAVIIKHVAAWMIIMWLHERDAPASTWMPAREWLF